MLQKNPYRNILLFIVALIVVVFVGFSVLDKDNPNKKKIHTTGHEIDKFTKELDADRYISKTAKRVTPKLSLLKKTKNSKTKVSLPELVSYLNEKIKPENDIVIGNLEAVQISASALSDSERKKYKIQDYNIGVLQGMSSIAPHFAKVGIDMLMAKYKETDISLFEKSFIDEMEQIATTDRYEKMLLLIVDVDSKGEPNYAQNNDVYTLMISELWTHDLTDAEFNDKLDKLIKY